MTYIRKLKSEITFSFLYDQFIFIKNSKDIQNSSFLQCLTDQKKAQSKILYLTQINSSRLYGLTQQECSKQFNDELKTKIALKELSERDILNFFLDFYFDLILDLLYRRIPLTSLLKSVQQQVQIECLQNLNVSNVLVLVFERLNLIDKINLGQILSCSYQSIPIFYKIEETDENQIYKNNLISAFYSFMDQFQNHIILNVCSSSIQKKQREEFFNYLANNKDIIADLNEGFNQRGTVHLYSQFPNSKLSQFTLLDICQLDLLNVQFLRIFTNLMNCSSIILIHLNFEKDFILCTNKYVVSVETQKIINTLNDKYSVIFIIHKAQKHKAQVEKYFKVYLEYHKFEYKLLLISENDPEPEYDNLFFQLKNQTLQQTKKQEIIQSFEEFLEAYISNSDFENLNTHIAQYKNLIQQTIKKQLILNKISDVESYKLIQHMFSYSNVFSELFYKEKIFDNLSRSYFRETENFVKKGEKLQQLKKKFESCNQLSEITIFFFNEITQNNYIKQSVISKILSDWKQPLVEENNKKIDQINQDIRNLEKVAFKQLSQKDQEYLEQLYKQKNQLIILQDNYDISIESFIREISLFTQNTSKNSFYKIEHAQLKVQIQSYYKYAFEKGIPIQFIDKTRKFGSNLLEEFFKQIDQKFRLSDYKIVSVVGPQSSAKSTLMNYLFRCSFETSSARCTKGMYFTKINFQGMNLIVIDTEGLLSNVFRDQSFDNSVMTLLFLISNVIIFNIKDESNSKMKEMMSITEEVIKLFNNIQDNYTVPEIFIALRDYFDRNNIELKKKQIINEMIQVNGIFESQSSKQQNKNQIKLKPENVFIFPSAFSELNYFESRFKHINTGFGEDVLQLRKSITNVLKQSKGYLSIQDFYFKAEGIWNRLKEHGHDLLKCITLEEYKSKKLLEEIALGYQKKIEEKKVNQIEEKEAILKNSLTDNYMDIHSFNRIKQEYSQFITTLNIQMNEELEDSLQQDYNDNKLINQLNPRDFYFILNKTQHRNKVNLQVRQNIFEQRIQSLFFGLQIDVLEKDFNKQIQQEVNQAQFEQNEQSLKKLLDQIQEEYSDKIKQLQKKFETTDELMRQQLEQLKNEYVKHYDQNLQNLIQEFSISQIAKQNFDDVKNIIQENQVDQIAKKFLVNSSRLSSSEYELLINKIQEFFQNLKLVKPNKVYQEQEIVKNIFQQMVDCCKVFFDSIQPDLQQYINDTNMYKYTFYILYQIIRDQVKKWQQQVLRKKMEKFQIIIDQKIQHIKKMSETSTDWVELGVQAMRSIQNQIVTTFIKKSLSNMEPVLNKTVDDLTSDYTKAIDNAFMSVYDSTEQKINIDNFLKYTVNINKYIDEMKRDQIKIKAEELVENKTTEFNLGLQNIIDELNQIILHFVNTEIFDFDQLIEKLNTIYFEGVSLQLGQEIIIENLKNKPQFIEEEEEVQDDDLNCDVEEEKEEEEQKQENNEVQEIHQDKDKSCYRDNEKVDGLTENEQEINSNKQSQKENGLEKQALDFSEIIMKSCGNNNKEQEDKQKNQIIIFNSSQSQIDMLNDKQKQDSEDSFAMDLNESVINGELSKNNNDKQIEEVQSNIQGESKNQQSNCMEGQDENQDKILQYGDQNNSQSNIETQEQEKKISNQEGDILQENEQDLCNEEKKEDSKHIEKINNQTSIDQEDNNKTKQDNEIQNEVDTIQVDKNNNSTKHFAENQEEQINHNSAQAEQSQIIENDNIQTSLDKVQSSQDQEDNDKTKQDTEIQNEVDTNSYSSKNFTNNQEEQKNNDSTQVEQAKLNEKGNTQTSLNSVQSGCEQEDDNKKKQDTQIQNETGTIQVDSNNNSSKNVQDKQEDDREQCLKINQNDIEDLQKNQNDKQKRASEQQLSDSDSGKNGSKKEKTRIKKIKIVKKYIPVQSLYIQGMRKIYNEINPTNGNKIILQFKEELNNEMEQMLKLHYQKMIGCQERCPFCGQKCHLELGHSGDHSVNDRHLIIGIHGYGKQEFYVNKFCYDTIDEPFRINYQRFENMYEASQKLFPNWSSCFSLDKKNNQDQNFSQILKQGYALTAKWFANHNNKSRLEDLKENVPQEFKDLAQNQEEIDETYKIQWKYIDDQSSDQSQDDSQDQDISQLKQRLLRLFTFIHIILSD
ncbi:endo-1,4-beta-xylanase xylA, putative (macronuclear) [Tetrahymena thermophila SB210]|uniref:Endo-1,4-beta-xylanase xylA, putative n=1 Tax=Tetrahymena thermophila (strain SB210) TaxID=312017 RepID=C0NA17_TETTS|nr:endo-1,4-beta-xylanase xylA, putative [Tetrahymena thermophila SB210]EEH11763.2 endo-1,4-beta-xylanase xylA, putative [Tetrahymena thermophila SB210]|eukprot:XP_002348338.2 endo-1,4-beta-xylanase xylA, putative [Tetrahymena thermophila SB210]